MRCIGEAGMVIIKRQYGMEAGSEHNTPGRVEDEGKGPLGTKGRKE